MVRHRIAGLLALLALIAIASTCPLASHAPN
jgi:hypothetical protein